MIYVYIAGINAASQEVHVFSRTRGVGINLAIKYYRVLCSSEAPAPYIRIIRTPYMLNP